MTDVYRCKLCNQDLWEENCNKNNLYNYTKGQYTNGSIQDHLVKAHKVKLNMIDARRKFKIFRHQIFANDRMLLECGHLIEHWDPKMRADKIKRHENSCHIFKKLRNTDVSILGRAEGMVKIYCPNCDKPTPTNYAVPYCDKWPDGVQKGKHGNVIDGTTTCEDDYCSPGEMSLNDYIIQIGSAVDADKLPHTEFKYCNKCGSLKY